MNLRSFSIALLISAVPLFATAQASDIKLNKGDFRSAEQVSRNGETIVRVQLSKSGKAKFKKLNAKFVNEKVQTEVAGVASNFKLREPIQGSSLEMGPYAAEDAAKVTSEINHQER